MQRCSRVVQVFKEKPARVHEHRPRIIEGRGDPSSLYIPSSHSLYLSLFLLALTRVYAASRYYMYIYVHTRTQTHTHTLLLLANMSAIARIYVCIYTCIYILLHRCVCVCVSLFSSSASRRSPLPDLDLGAAVAALGARRHTGPAAAPHTCTTTTTTTLFFRHFFLLLLRFSLS